MANNISLIGMPGAGKSTIGPLLANALGLAFLDSDVLMEQQQQKKLQQILDQGGPALLQSLEEQTILALAGQGRVIATGGSVIYSQLAMRHLQNISTVVFLDLPLSVIRQRLGNFSNRGLVRPHNQDIEQLFAERLPLYRRYANITVACDRLAPEEITRQIVSLLGANATS